VGAAIDLGAYEYQAVNHPPMIGDFSKKGLSSQGIAFAAADFIAHFTDADQDALSAVQITALPEYGALYLGINAVTLNQIIPAADLGTLKYHCPGYWSGTDTISWNASDGKAYAAGAATINISIKIPIFLPMVIY
jgi:hypothetical protein